MSATLTFPGQSTTREVDLQLLSDDELVELVYEFVQTFDDCGSTPLYFLFEEIFGRWAPESEWRHMCRHQHESTPEPDQIRRELEGTRDAMVERAARRLSRLRIAGGAS